MSNKTNGNVTKVVAAAAVLCALAACNNSNKTQPSSDHKQAAPAAPKGAIGGTGTTGSGSGNACADSSKATIVDAPNMAHYDKEGQLSMDCTAEITTPGKEGPQCLTMQKSQGSEPASAGQKGSTNYTWVSASGADLEAWGFTKLEAALVENTADNSLAPSGYNIDHSGKNSPEGIENGTVAPVKVGVNTETFQFETGDGKATVSHTLTMTCNVTSPAKKPVPAPEKTTTPAPVKTTTPAPVKTTTPAPEKTGVPAPQKTGTPAKQAPQKASQQAPSKGGAQQKQ